MTPIGGRGKGESLALQETRPPLPPPPQRLELQLAKPRGAEGREVSSSKPPLGTDDTSLMTSDLQAGRGDEEMMGISCASETRRYRYS